MAKVLVVDDDPQMRSLLVEWLAGLGHEAYAAPDPLSGAVRAKTLKPDVLVLDYQMPAGGAPALLKSLEAVPELARLPVLMCTGLPLDEVKKACPESPLRRYARK